MSSEFSSIIYLKRSPSFKCHHSVHLQLCCSCSSQILWDHWNYPERFPWPYSWVFQWFPPQIPNNGGSFSKVSDTSWSNRWHDGCLLLTNPPLLGMLYLSLGTLGSGSRPPKGLFSGFEVYNHLEIILPRMRFYGMQRTAALESSVCLLSGPAPRYVHSGTFFNPRERQSCFSQAALAVLSSAGHWWK